MWTRITSSDQLKSVGVGTLLIKSLSGANNSLDINDKEKISVRYVTKNLPKFEEFDLSLIPYQMEHFVYVLYGLTTSTFAAMHKKYEEIVADGNYWIFSGKQS
jgi:hypothetical protein